MKDTIFLEILCRIKSCLRDNERYIAIEYINLEISNLKDITAKECMKYKSFSTWFCYNCQNKNCRANKTLN